MVANIYAINRFRKLFWLFCLWLVLFKWKASLGHKNNRSNGLLEKWLPTINMDEVKCMPESFSPAFQRNRALRWIGYQWGGIAAFGQQSLVGKVLKFSGRFPDSKANSP